ncbi:alpha/beta fold hydrolase [Marinicella sediminis]|uniref:Proline iminopeptidase n=1 Tax=Marinicella sediminis TaxID=1792834 RepID=A0ABV7JBN2_9GAMM|nr:alpha/beta hydrolase [Marinicella sediminis]
MKHIHLLFILLSVTLLAEYSAAAPDGETIITFTSGDSDSKGQQVSAYAGQFVVTENRSAESSRKIKLHYVRFPSTSQNPGPPIVYLAGGPGGSGISTAENRRYGLFMALREVADVIALDQRGTGQSNDLPHCESNQFLPQDQAIDDDAYIRLNQVALAECLTYWQQKGVDLKAYNTLESVNDLDDLRQHLGAEKISLWGISYGSHLALAAIKTRPQILHKVMIASAEGLAQTIKYPARTDAYFQRLNSYLNSHKEDPFDYLKLMRQVHQQLDQQPMRLEWQNDQQQTIRYHLQSRDMKQLASAMISDPGRAQQLLQLYHALQAGIHMPVQNIIQRYMSPEQPIGFHPMSTAMDLASGISPERLKIIEEQSQSSLLGGYLNFSLYFTKLAEQHHLDLDESFRSLPVSDIPTLLISGTLDGRTYIESQLEATDGLSNRQTIKVINGGHNLFKSSPLVIKNMLLFMQDQVITDPVINTNPLGFTPD